MIPLLREGSNAFSNAAAAATYAAELDVPLWRAVTDWLGDDWPFERPAYAERR